MANDTDIIMMCLYFITQLHDLRELWAKNMNNYLPVHAITDSLAVKYDIKPADIAFILIRTYLITGCDTLSYL